MLPRVRFQTAHLSNGDHAVFHLESADYDNIGFIINDAGDIKSVILRREDALPAGPVKTGAKGDRVIELFGIKLYVNDHDAPLSAAEQLARLEADMESAQDIRKSLRRSFDNGKMELNGQHDGDSSRRLIDPLALDWLRKYARDPQLPSELGTEERIQR